MGVKIVDSPQVYSWCRGCDIDEAFDLIQAIVATNPYDAKNWNNLATLLHVYGHVALALSIFVIAKRLCQIQGYPFNAIEKNIADITSNPDAMTADISTLFVDGSWDTHEIVQRSLTCREGASGAIPSLMGV